MPEKNQRINFVVSSDQKQRWQEVADESDEYSGLSDLIRLSVSRELAGGHESTSGTDDELKEAVYDLVDSNRRIEAGIGNVDDRLDGIESSLSEPPEDVQDLMTDVFDVLPEEGEVGRTQSDVLSGDDVVAPDGRVVTGRVADIADHLGEASYQVRRAIEQLQADSSLVESTTVEGDERFYRRA
jgi:hypothetical protein